MWALIAMVNDGDFAVRVSTDPRQVTVAEMFEAGRIVDKRFTVLPDPRDVVYAYQLTGMTPGRGDFFISDKCGCGLGVVACKEGVRCGDHNGAMDFWLSRMTEAWIDAFGKGFDGERPHPLYETDDRLTVYLQGRACWNAVVEAGLTQEVLAHAN